MHSRRARPTIRVISEDLNDGWGNPFPRRAVEEGDFRALHPISELHHPLILKAAECIGPVEGEDSDEGPVRSSTTYHLREVKVQQWRGGVWRDPATGVHWLIVAGLAKGDHLAGSTIEGTGVRALCGIFFVPHQDHTALPPCPTCSQEYERLPAP